MKELNDNLKDALKFASSIVPDETDWLVVKKLVLRYISPKNRKNFTTRDQKTKKHHPFNEFELLVCEEWLNLTGKRLIIPIEKRIEQIDEGYIY